MQNQAMPLKIVMIVLIVVVMGATFTSVLAQNAAGSCTALGYGVTVPHDVLSGLPRAVCEPPTIGIFSPRDPASGLPTGK